MAKQLGWYFAEQLVLKITLWGSKPTVWRRVEVHSGMTLEALHDVIQCVFEWDDSHMHHFIVTPGGKTTRMALREATYFQPSPPGGFVDVFNLGEGRSKGTDEVMIGQILTGDCNQMIYEYDFGDSWNHIVKVEKRTPGGEQNFVPVCLAGLNAAPSDDMGGTDGYCQWVQALRDEDNPMHEEAVDWLGEDFDPERFDLEQVNKRLKSVFKPLPRKPRKPRKKAKKG